MAARTLSTVLFTTAVVASLAAAPAPAAQPVQLAPGDGTVQISWSDTGAGPYEVLRDGVVIATTTATTHLDTVDDTTAHTYEVVADGLPLATPLTTVAADTTVAVDEEVNVRVLRWFEGGATLFASFPEDSRDIAAIQVHAEGRLLGRHVTTGGSVVFDVWGLAPALLDSLQIVLEDLVGNTRITTTNGGNGPSVLLDLRRLRDLPLPPVRVRATACTNGTTVTWDTLGAHSGSWAVAYDDGSTWFTVDEPRATIPADVLHFRLATWVDGRLSDWSPPLLNQTTGAGIGRVPTCAVQVTEPGNVRGVQVTAAANQGSTWASVGVAGSTATLFVDGDGVVGARVSGGDISSPFHVGATGGGRRIHVPLRAAQVGTDGTVRADLVGADGTTLASVDIPVPTPRIETPAAGGDLAVDLVADTAHLTTSAAEHAREVLRDGVVVGHLPAGATTATVAGHQEGHVHAYQLRGIGSLPLTSAPVIATR